MRLAAKLTSKFPSTRVIVDNYDGVCTAPSPLEILFESEFGVTRKLIDNPVSRDSDYAVYTTDVNEQLQVKDCLQVTSFLSGESVVLPSVHSFGHVGLRDQANELNITVSSRNITRSWYRQSFHNYGHDEITFELHGRINNQSPSHYEYSLLKAKIRILRK